MIVFKKYIPIHNFSTALRKIILYFIKRYRKYYIFPIYIILNTLLILNLAEQNTLFNFVRILR